MLRVQDDPWHFRTIKQISYRSGESGYDNAQPFGEPFE